MESNGFMKIMELKLTNKIMQMNKLKMTQVQEELLSRHGTQ